MGSWNENRFENSDYVSFSELTNNENTEEPKTCEESVFVYQEYTEENTAHQHPQELNDACQTSEASTSREFNWKIYRPSFVSSLLSCTLLSAQITFISGVVFGVVTTTIWWLDLNLAQCCYSYTNRWYQMPVKYQRIRLTTEVVEGFILQLWPLSILILAFRWSLLKKLQIPFIGITAAFTDTCCRLFVYVFAEYKAKGVTLFLNFIFILVTLLSFFKVARFITVTTNNQIRPAVLTLKLSVQAFMGILFAGIFNYVLADAMISFSDFGKAILASSLPIMFFFPKLLINYVIGRQEGVFSPQKAISFTLVYQVGSTMLCRLAQAKNENLEFFILISVAHGIFNVIDKLILEIREKVLRFIFRACRGNSASRSPQMNRLLADQAIVTFLAETNAILTSVAAIEILPYYYGMKDTGERPNGYSLFQNFLIRGIHSILCLYFCHGLNLFVDLV